MVECNACAGEQHACDFMLSIKASFPCLIIAAHRLSRVTPQRAPGARPQLPHAGRALARQASGCMPRAGCIGTTAAVSTA